MRGERAFEKDDRAQCGGRNLFTDEFSHSNKVIGTNLELISELEERHTEVP